MNTKDEALTSSQNSTKPNVVGSFYTSEVWKEIEKFEGIYSVSNFGRVKNLITNRILSSKRKERFEVCLHSKFLNKSVLVNRLVYSVFHGVRLQRNHIILHKDGDNLNCHIDNLKLITKRNYVSAIMSNTSGYTGVTSADKYGQHTAKICFEGVEVLLHVSKNINECHKIYQLAKKMVEDYDRKKMSIISNEARNRLMNISVKSGVF